MTTSTTSARRVAPWVALGGFLVATYGVAALGGLATASHVESWYADAAKPPLTPPNWLFGPAWTLLYGLIAVSGWLVWRHTEPDRGTAESGLRLWWLQLTLNLAWTPVFFALEWLWAGLAVIVVLDIVVVVTILRFRRVSAPGAALLVPYLGWIVLATWLNLGVAWLN